jgi:hypothetical protein
MTVTQIKLPALLTSLAYAATVRTWFVGKGEPTPGTFYARSPIRMGELAGQGLVPVNSRIAVGDWVWPDSISGQPSPLGEPKVVAAIDETSRAATGEWVITWVQVPAQREGEPIPAVVLDPERFTDIMLAWVYEQTIGNQSMADLATFAPDDIPVDSAVAFAEQLISAGLLRWQPGFTAAVSLTADGAEAARNAAAERDSKTRRTEALQNGIVQWIYDNEGLYGTIVDLRKLLDEPLGVFRGRFFTEEELYIGYTDLVELGLVRSFSPWWCDPTLTANGRICAGYHEGNVRDFMNPKPQQTSPTIINIGSNIQAAIGDARQTSYAPPPAQEAPLPAQPAPSAPTAEAAGPKEPAEPERAPSRMQKVRDTVSSPLVLGIATIVIAIGTILTVIPMLKG